MPLRQLSPNEPILIGEKDPAASQALGRVLMDLGFCNVVQANNAYRFMQYGKVQKFSVIFIASSLGRAVESLAGLRMGGENKETPIVFIHGASEKSVAKAAASAGANGAIQYPIENPRVRALLEDLFDMYIVAQSGGAAVELGTSGPEPGGDKATPLEASRKCLERGDLDEAERTWLRVRDEEGESTEFYCGLAEVYLVRGDREAAERMLKEADRLEPFVRREFRRQAPAFVRRGRQKFKEERYEEAILEFEGAIVANPKSVGGYFGLGQILQALGDEEGAEQLLQRVLELDEEPADLHLYNEMGLVSRRKREFEAALFAFDKALSLAPQDAILHYNKAMVYVAQKKYNEALPLLKKAVAINPDFVEAQQAESAVAHILSGRHNSSAA